MQIREPVRRHIETVRQTVRSYAQRERTFAAVVRLRLLTITASYWLATRLSLLAVSLFAPPLLLAAKVEFPHPATSLVDAWYVWDARRFVGIATAGYARPAYAAWFPLYPLLIKAGTLLTFNHADPRVVAMLISSAATCAAFYLIARLAVREGAFIHARSAVLALAAWPFAFFLAAAYSDALFLALAALALYCSRRHRWLFAALCAFLAGLTRITAVALIPAILIDAYESGALTHAWIRWREAGQTVVAMAGVPLALATYAAYNWLRFGDPLNFVRVESADFGRHLMWPWQSVGIILGQLHAATTAYASTRIWLDLAPVLVMVAFTALAARTLPRSLLAYQVVILALCVIAPFDVAHAPESAWAASGRYLIASIPLWLYLGRQMSRWPALESAYTAIGLMLQAVFLAAFLAGAWII